MFQFSSEQFRLKVGLAEMLKGGVIMDVTNAEQAKIAEDAGACAVMALERVPADIRRDGGVARMADPLKIKDLSWQIHAVVARDLAIIPLWQLDNYVAFKATVQGVKVHPYYLFGSPEEWHIGEE